MFLVGGSRYECRSSGGFWVGVGKFWHIWARMGKGGQVWIGQTDRAGMGDMDSGVILGMRADLGVGVDWCGQVWADMGKGGQRLAGLDGSE